MTRGFFKLIADSWKGFRENFTSILILFILLGVIPSLILGYVGLPMINDSNSLDFYSTNQGILYVTLSLVFMFATALLSASILVLAFSNKILKFKEAISSGSKYWISYILLSIVLILLMFLLIIPSVIAIYFSYTSANIFLLILGVLLFLIPIYFVIRWNLSLPILIAENKGVFQSLKRSFAITKGKFWKVLFYLILLVIIIAIIAQIFGAIGYLLNLKTGNIVLTADAITGFQSMRFTTAGFFIQQIFSLASALITTPLSLFFLKNLYQEIAEKKK